MRLHRAVCGAPLVLLLLLSGAQAAPPAPPPAPPSPAVDDEFLEFLGSVDSDSIRPEDLWLVDYWSKADAGKAQSPPGGRPPAGPKPPAAPPKPSTPPPGTQNNG